MNELKHVLEKQIATELHADKAKVVDDIQQLIADAGYEIAECNGDKPWGAYFRLNGDQANRFVEEFFPGLSPTEARLGNDTAELSPKFLIVAPGERLSWQYHHHRAERWAFLTDGMYHKSTTDEPGEPVAARPGDIVQFDRGERHRLVGMSGEYTLVAEIWQHTDTDPEKMSDEDDIVRLQDDYQR